MSYPKAIVLNILALERATKKMRKNGGTMPSPPKKKTYSFAEPAKAPASPPPAANPAATKPEMSHAASFAVTSSSFSNDEPAAPARTTAHSPSATGPTGETETDRRKRMAREAATPSCTPDWVKNAKNAQEAADMIAAKEWMQNLAGEP